MKLEEARAIAERVVERMRPHCDRIEIAGSIRRRKPNVKDIEVVCIPKPYDVGLFASGIATVVDEWPIVRGQLPCLYTQRTLPEGIALDLFVASPANWGSIFGIRTGSAEFSHQMLAKLNKAGFESAGGRLRRIEDGQMFDVREEADWFRFARTKYVEPWERNL